MFAPPIAKQKTKSAEFSRAPVEPQRHRQPALSQVQLLQRRIGNQALLRLFAQHRNELSAPGNMARLPGILQAKLRIGAVNDPLEHEADRVADHVMRMPASEVALTSAPQQISRKCAECAEDEEKLQMKEAGPQAATAEASASVHEVLRAPGQPLDAATRAYFEPRFGQDFSRVRVHTGAAAGQSAQAVNARAYTVGHDIIFAPGQYSPTVSDGQKLIAHELTHVLQQQSSVPINGGRQNGRISTAMAATGALINERTLQRAVCPGGWRHADTDETALQAADNIERAFNFLSAIWDNPSVDINVKKNVVTAIKLSIVAWKAYAKEIEWKCSGGKSPFLLAQTGTMNPLSVAIAAFAALLLGEAARRTIISMSEQRAVENLGTSLSVLAAEVKELTKAVETPQPVPTPQEKGEKTTVSPVPETPPAPEERRRKPKCPYPTGLSKGDPIQITWFKPVHDSFYPKEIVLTDGTKLDRDDPKTKLPDGTPVGVLSDYWPSKGKLLQAIPRKREGKQQEYKDVLARWGYVWGKTMQPDHVQDLDWDGPDAFGNLWPFETSTNLSAGSSQNVHQPVDFCLTEDGPKYEGIGIGIVKKVLFGRFFEIRDFKHHS